MLKLFPNTESIIFSYEKLLAFDLVKITKKLFQTKDGGASFNCVIQVPYPNSANIPKEVELIVEIPSEYPLGSISIKVEDENLIGFPHQNTNNGELCLFPQEYASVNEDRLINYIEWAIRWFSDASNNNLLKPNDVYEIPYLNRKYLRETLLLFQEKTSNFDIWKNEINKMGSFSFFKNSQGLIFPVNFWRNRNNLLSYFWNKHFKNKNKEAFKGTWIIFNDIRFFRYRPPKTFKEFFEVAQKNGFDAAILIQNILNNIRFLGYEPLVLIGFPIPEKVGAPNNQIYWVAFKFKIKSEIKKYQNSLNLNSKKNRRFYKLSQEFLPVFDLDDEIEWIKEENCCSERIFSRSSFSNDFQNKKIFLIGCGSLGSSLADLLVRGGVKDITLCDKEIIEFGNFCRHILAGDSLEKGKAEELCKKLSLVNPVCDIKTHIENIPTQDESFLTDLINSDLVIDCTSDRDGLIWLSNFCKQNNKILCSLSFNSKASYFTAAISSPVTYCNVVKHKIWNKVKNNETPFNSEDYLEKINKQLLIQNAGCYHPTFPALYNNIQSLVSIFVGLLPSVINNLSWGVIIHRKDLEESVINSPFTIWKKEIN
ncbi:MAG: hypothetical protein A2X64_05725 [Ignavibacteria bacterium GWF2_33_9]|nr:MAG: hypothetical protein A2X64_05725 [Ignavibacteria bacterium GWF2_33_9]